MPHSFTDQFTPLSFPNLGLVRFPTVEVSTADKEKLGLRASASNRDLLRALAWSGYQALRAQGRFEGIAEVAVVTRFKEEFATFDKTGVHDYLLLVWDINCWCDQQGIVRGYGRGSAAGSLTLYCLGVVRVNPLKHNLSFIRFLSDARLKPVVKDGVTYVDGKMAPDIDCDYQYLRRADVVRYVEERYPGRTCKISTRMELTGKMALKEVCKVYLNLPDEAAKAISDHVEVRFGQVQPLAEAQANPGLRQWLDQDKEHTEALRLAMGLEGLTVSHGVHPSGVGVSYDPIDGHVPVEMSKNGEVVSSYDMETVAGLFMKLDILGVRTLDLLADTARLAGVSVDSIDVNDPSIYRYLKEKDSYLGLFQIGEGLTKEATRKIGPRQVEELSVVLAISRPGAMAYIPQFAEYVKAGTVKPFHPLVDPVLKYTGGALVMQEQVTQIGHDVFGLSWVDADSLRYAISKKKVEEMVKWEAPIRANGLARGIPQSVIDLFWATCKASAAYSFNFSHAVSYGYLAAATTYLKANHPLPFYLTSLRLSREEPAPIETMNQIIAEMRLGGYSVLPPDIVKSESDFSIAKADEGMAGGGIRFGLSNIRGISDQTMGKLLSFRKDRQFETRFQLFEAAKAARVPINTVTSLIYSGCLDPGSMSRSYYALTAQLYNLLTEREKPLVHKLAPQYEDDLIALLKDLPTKKDEKGKALMRESRLSTLRRDYARFWDMYQSHSANEELSMYLSERMLLGFSFTSTLHKVYSARVPGLIPLRNLVKLKEQLKRAEEPETDARPEVIRVVAFIGEIKVCASKKDQTPYWKVTAYDDEAEFRLMLYGREKVESCLAYHGKLPKEGEIVIAAGTLSKDRGLLFCDSLVVQPNPIVLKPYEVELPNQSTSQHQLSLST